VGGTAVHTSSIGTLLVEDTPEELMYGRAAYFCDDPNVSATTAMAFRQADGAPFQISWDPALASPAITFGYFRQAYWGIFITVRVDKPSGIAEWNVPDFIHNNTDGVIERVAYVAGGYGSIQGPTALITCVVSMHDFWGQTREVTFRAGVLREATFLVRPYVTSPKGSPVYMPGYRRASNIFGGGAADSRHPVATLLGDEPVAWTQHNDITALGSLQLCRS
jgi:hypothetical protein